tara:strand:- start:2303 stop:3511 length:1209 start_codon:yes stop_codon:yes gene_type:complete
MAKWQILLIKEIRHLFRDTKTIIQTVVVPTFLTPLLIGGIVWYISSIAIEESKKDYDVAIYDVNNTQLITKFDEAERLNISKYESIQDVIDSVTNDDSEIGIVIDDLFQQNINDNISSSVTIYSKNIDTFSQAKSLAEDIIDSYENDERSERLSSLNLDEEFINPIDIIEEDLTTEKEAAGSFFGGILAFFFVMYVITGSMYPAIDLGAGEKERGTMETLISTNISSLEIIIGKMFSVTASAVLTATFSLLGFIVPLLIIFFFYADSIPESLFDTLSSLVNPIAFLGIFGLIIPLSILMGALLLAVSVYSKNTKEAGLLLGNLVIVFFLPAYIPLFNPGIELDFVGSLIPCYNLALLTNSLIAENTNWLLYCSALGSTVVYCCIAIYITYIMFDDEKIIFRS